MYRVKKFDDLKGLRDFSNQVLKNHLTLYQGYVKNTNELANPMPYEAARDMEIELAIGLREEGYAVWQA